MFLSCYFLIVITNTLKRLFKIVKIVRAVTIRVLPGDVMLILRALRLLVLKPKP